ncbi:proline dehydrogenase family protein [Isoptericola sp. 4D.3]|uniref:Proline dehydrogenase family protein n=1 Tax=Isoptericola peretonis TaxID=2918523 RepID=A0ABT0IYA3_9MICO|nr:proline dehydrogenase family protein [Isoptericola sp. 4D.3]
MSTPSVAEAAADTLRAWALDEDLRSRVLGDGTTAALAQRVARRYVAGETVGSALAAIRAGARRGHLASVELVGESVRDAEVAERETRAFLDLVEALRDEPTPTTVSFDLSHVGSLVDPDLGLRNARRLAEASASLGTALMVSAEGSDRTDLVLDLYEALAADFPHVGITLQARLRRTAADLRRVLELPGTVRLVKGAFLEPDDVAHRRGSTGLADAYLALVAAALDAGHPLAIATHDADLVGQLVEAHGPRLRAPGVELEMLRGLGTSLLDRLHTDGHRTREYVVFGTEWWLYALNRIAEDPADRVLTALADLGAPRT